MKTLLLLLSSASIYVTQHIPKPAVRVRLNHGVFEQASSIVAGIIEYEIPRIRIANTQQCFTEGCIQIHSLQIQSFRQAQAVTFEPQPPNQFVLRLRNFDFFVTGALGGTIQILLQIPIMGTVVVTGTGMSVSAVMDLQKTAGDEPYLRYLSCQIDGGVVDTRVANMGIFTDTVNTKYRATMAAHSRQVLQEAICQHMQRLTQQHFSARMAQMPSQLSASKTLSVLIPSGNSSLQISDGINFSAQDFNQFFNVNRLRSLFVETTMLDASSTRSDFALGLSGRVFDEKSPMQSPYRPPFPFRLPHISGRRMIEVIISEYTLNSLLWHAHRTNSLLFHIDSHTPAVGKLMKTTCSVDEVCLSDQIEEIGEKYPNRSLEIIIRTTSPPVVSFSQDNAAMRFSGRCLFFLEGTREKVGVIPFTADISLKIVTEGNMLKGKLSIPSLVFHEDVDFFGLSARDLEGFKTSIKGAMENLVTRALSQGVPLDAERASLPLRLSALQVSALPGVFLLQGNIDLYNALYSHH